MNMAGATGIGTAQKVAFKALGAVEKTSTNGACQSQAPFVFGNRLKIYRLNSGRKIELDRWEDHLGNRKGKTAQKDDKWRVVYIF